jgi:hypothetical protein
LLEVIPLLISYHVPDGTFYIPLHHRSSSSWLPKASITPSRWRSMIAEWSLQDTETIATLVAPVPIGVPRGGRAPISSCVRAPRRLTAMVASFKGAALANRSLRRCAEIGYRCWDKRGERQADSAPRTTVPTVACRISPKRISGQTVQKRRRLPARSATIIVFECWQPRRWLGNWCPVLYSAEAGRSFCPAYR